MTFGIPETGLRFSDPVALFLCYELAAVLQLPLPGSGSALSGDGHTGRRDLGGMLGRCLGGSVPQNTL